MKEHEQRPVFAACRYHGDLREVAAEQLAPQRVVDNCRAVGARVAAPGAEPVPNREHGSPECADERNDDDQSFRPTALAQSS